MAPTVDSDQVEPRQVAVVGVPNSGKSLVFARLSGRFATTSNYPHTTTELQRERATLGGEQVTLIDTPGITGLEFCSEDELPTRNLLHGSSHPAIVIQVIDATSLYRSLILTAQLADLELPLLVCLNMADEARRRGLRIDVGRLGELLGLPVVEVSAIDGRGVAATIGERLPEARAARRVAYPAPIEAKLAELQTSGGVASRAERVREVVESAREGVAEFEPGQSIWHMLLEAHHHWAQEVAGQVVQRPREGDPARPGRGPREILADLALHPVGGWAFLILTTVVVYQLVARVGVGILADGLESWVVAPTVAWIGNATGPGLLQDVLVGEFGLLSLGLFNAVCTVLPILSVFYLVFGLLEDIGYFPLLSVQFDRLLRFMGLTGRAVLPITLGFGCNSVATMAAGGLDQGRQRLIACFLIALGIPCAVQLGVMVAILSTVPVGVLAGLLGIVLLLQVTSGTILARVMRPGEHEEFLVELPPLRAPSLRNVLAKTYHRLLAFFREACPMFIASAAVLLALDLSGLLAGIRAAFAPVVVTALGLPARCADVLLMTVARREVGAVMMKDLVDQGTLDLRQTFVGLLVMTLFVPCMSNTLIMGRVLGWRASALIFVAVTLIALITGTVANALWGSFVAL